MTFPHFRLALSILTLSATVACSTPPPPPPAALAFNGTSTCSAKVDPSVAEKLTVKKRKTSANLSKTIDAASPCRTVHGQERPYALFRLPEGVPIESIQAGGVFQRLRVFAAEVKTLDSELVPVRTFEAESFLNRGGSWSVFSRADKSEKYILIQADPTLIGEGYDFTLGGDAPPPVDTSKFVVDTMPETHKDYSYEGLVFVRIYLSEPAAIPPKSQ